MSTTTTPDTVKEVTGIIMHPWGFYYRSIRVFKYGSQFGVFGGAERGKPNHKGTIQEIKTVIDNAYLSLQKSIR